MFKVLVTEPVHETGLELLARDPDIQVEQKLRLSREELLDAVEGYDALLTRSGTPVDRELLLRATRLKVIARAGVGVDNIDIAEASRRGVVVINAPTGNTLAAAELTMANLLALCRKVPQAYTSLLDGEWERKRFMGTQLFGKRLLVVGLGRIGGNVALRARSFGMDVSAFDPYVSASRAESLGVTLAEELPGALALADVVTLHVPLTAETRGMIDEKALRAMKRGSFLVNCARGGLVDERACAEALREGRLAGIAFDVYGAEPPGKEHPFLAEDLRDRIVLTPHIGANTREAQSAVAQIATSNLVNALKGFPYEHAVNLPFMEGQLPPLEKTYLSLARKLGNLAGQLLRGAPKSIRLLLKGGLFKEDSSLIHFDVPYRYAPYTVAALKGLLEVRHGPEVSYMAAPLMAEERHLSVEEGKGESGTYKNLLELVVEGDRESVALQGTVTEEGRQRVVRLNGYPIEFIPERRLLLFSNHDRPGVIGKVGTLLGDAGVNIANFALGRKNGSGLALAALQIDNDIAPDVVRQLSEDADLLWAAVTTFPEEL